MCWGFECGDGWYDLIDQLCADIQAICDRTGGQIKAVQVKEKFGALRFYINHGNDEIYDLITKAEHQSELTCERCGKPGKIKGRGWRYCACDEHTSNQDKDDGKGIDEP
jgi:predicted nucleic acid-binding Zn ribbon protein